MTAAVCAMDEDGGRRSRRAGRVVRGGGRPRAVVAGIRAALVLCLLGPVAAAAEADDVSERPCRARATVDPSVAWVGEQVIHRVELDWDAGIDRMEWLRPPAFPDHRVVPLSGGAVDAPASGNAPTTRVERRALIAGRAGQLLLPESTLVCVGRDGPRDGDPVVTLPAIGIEVRPPPTDGRPDDFTGLVGPVEWRRRVDRQRIALGERITLELRLSGPNDIADARLEPDWARGDGDAVAFDAFAAGERVHETRGERLVTRRTLRFELVPRRAGAIEIPARSLVWLDPDTGRYVRTSVPAIAIEVLPARAPDTTGDGDAPFDAAAEPPAARRTGGETRTGEGAGRLGRTVLAAIALATLSFAAGWLLFRSRASHRPIDTALQAADAARSAGDRRREAEALERALRAALAERSPALAGLSPPELAFRGAQDERLALAADLLGGLEAVRFGAEPGVPDRDAVRSWIATALR